MSIHTGAGGKRCGIKPTTLPQKPTKFNEHPCKFCPAAHSTDPEVEDVIAAMRRGEDVGEYANDYRCAFVKERLCKGWAELRSAAIGGECVNKINESGS